ncbi:CBN-SRX-42 protein [Caenorhabditis brenneri]|nr:CBN-SRX-42 protein [Caenorhabditis brenneri]
MERTTDDVIAGAVISVMVFIGFLLIITVLIGCYRIPAMRGSFGILTANQNFSQLIACIATIIFYSFGLTLDYRFLVENSGYFGNCSALILTVITTNFLLISLNRTCAICFPIYYKLFFGQKMVLILVFICWLIPGGISCYYIFELHCKLTFSQFGWLFTSDLTIVTCGAQFKNFLLKSQTWLSALIGVADLATLYLLGCKTNVMGSMSADKKRTEKNFAIQVLIQGIVFNLHALWLSNAFNWLPGAPSSWKLFFTITFSSNLLMIFDPAVVIVFNREFRHWIFHSRSTVFVATISASPGAQRSSRSNPKSTNSSGMFRMPSTTAA